MNIYEIYEQNGQKAGFYVKRKSWHTIYAKVLSIAGKISGPLKGKPPYYDNPVVTVDVYHTNGRLRNSNMSLYCPGSPSYEKIQPPSQI